MQPVATDHSAGARRQAFAFHTLLAFAALAILSLVVCLAGHWFGRTLSEGGHTSDTTRYRVTIGENVLTPPANTIRFKSERRDGPSETLHLYLHWPDMAGYSAETRDAFNNTLGRSSILFLTLTSQTMSRDMSGRFEPIYSQLIEDMSRQGPGGLAVHDFKPDSGYESETLVVGPAEQGKRFVARCLVGRLAEQSLAGCERDVAIGRALSLTYRFPRHLLKDWRALDAAVIEFAGSLLQAD